MAERNRHSVARTEGKNRSSMRPAERDDDDIATNKRRRTEIRQTEKRQEEPEIKKGRKTIAGVQPSTRSPATKQSKEKRRETMREQRIATSPAVKPAKTKRSAVHDEEESQPSPSPRAAKSSRTSKHDRREHEEAGARYEAHPKSSSAAEGNAKADGKKPLGKDKGKAPAAGGGYKTARDEAEAEAYDSLGAAIRFHDDVPTDMPEAKRLQRLLELAVEAEQVVVSERYQGRLGFIAGAFEEVAAAFVMETERDTIRKVNKTRQSMTRPAQTAYARGEVEPMKPNPLNDQRTAQEKKLQEGLAAFEKELVQWTALANAPAPDGGAGAGGGRGAHSVLEELSIADRNLLCSRGREELPELLAWAQGFVTSATDRLRPAVTLLEDRAAHNAQRRTRLEGRLRQTTRAPYAGVTDPKQLLRAVVSA